MKKYILDTAKYGTDPKFWEWFYEGKAKDDFFFLNPKSTIDDYKKKLMKDLNEFKENLDWAKCRNAKDTPVILHSKESLLAQIEALERVCQEIDCELTEV